LYSSRIENQRVLSSVYNTRTKILRLVYGDKLKT